MNKQQEKLGMSNAKFIAKLEDYTNLQVTIKSLEDKAKALKAVIKDEMKRRGASKLIIDKYIVTYSKFNRESFDSKTFKEDHPRMYSNYTKATPVEMVTVK